jgi:RNA polymerase sigma-70 factor, ECF subfamily
VAVNAKGLRALYPSMQTDTRMMSGVEEVRIAPALGHDFDRLFREEGPGVWRTIYAFAGGRRDVAEEAVAEAFARAIAHAEGIRDPLRWIYRVAFRVAREELRRERGRAPEADEAQAPPELEGLMQALRELSPNQRAAIVLRHVVDLDVAEVARRMGIAVPTARVHMHRGRKRLRELLGAEEVD